MAGFHALSARTLAGEVVKMDRYKGKVVLVENTASLWGTTTRDFTQMNELCEKVTFGFIDNQMTTYKIQPVCFLVFWEIGCPGFSNKPGKIATKSRIVSGQFKI